MPKLIDADKLKKHYAWWDNEDKKIFDTIVDLQPIVDAKPVVRCKDCVYLEPSLNSDWSWCWYFDSKVRGDDFCSHGERKEDAKIN